MPDKILLAIFALYMPLSLPSSEQQCAQVSKGIGEELIIRENGKRGSKGGAVMRALASHQCCPGSNPCVDAICGLSLLLVLSFAPRGFSPGTPVFSSPQKPTFSNSNSIWNARTRLNEFIWILFASLRGKIGIYKFFLQFTILGGWVKKTKIGRLIYKNHLSFVVATAGGCKFPFGSSFSFSFPLIVITSSCSLLAPGSRSLHFVINFSLLICNILATLYMLNF